ncbi:MAG: MinD/ParA family protein [Desulfobacteraceae bacterium]|nr:MinD/ParA family protein [Desulfobacteraceae bacterium]
MKHTDNESKIIHLNQHKKVIHGAGSMRSLEKQRPKVLAITSGKGGVGKTNIVANLGYSLARFGQKVLILDADLGLGNLDVLLGLAPQWNLSHVISGEKSLADIVVPGPGKLKILPAASGIQEMTALSDKDRYQIFSQLEAFLMDFDIMLIDTAAGISSNVLYFNVNADEVLVVATPEPTSITDAYALMKVLSLKYDTVHFKLIVNSAASKHEAQEVYNQLNLVADRFLNVTIEYYGSILRDELILKGVRQQKIISEIAPLGKASRGFTALARKIADASNSETNKRASKWYLPEIPVQP